MKSPLEMPRANREFFRIADDLLNSATVLYRAVGNHSAAQPQICWVSNESLEPTDEKVLGLMVRGRQDRLTGMRRVLGMIAMVAEDSCHYRVPVEPTDDIADDPYAMMIFDDFKDYHQSHDLIPRAQYVIDVPLLGGELAHTFGFEGEEQLALEQAHSDLESSTYSPNDN